MKFLADVLPQYAKPHVKTIIKWSITGYLIRVTMMPLFAHADLFTNAWISFILKDHLQLVTSNDPPLIYYFLASFYAFLDPILPKEVFSDVTSRLGFTPVQLTTVFRSFQPGTWTFIFISKIPFLIFDFTSALLLLRLLDEKGSLLAFKLWMINPVSIYTSYYIGQYDIVPTFFLILALHFFKKQRVNWTMLSLGLAGAFKLFPLLFLPAVAFVYLKKRDGFITKISSLSFMFAIGLLPFIASLFASFLTPVYYEPVNAATPRGFDFNGFFGRMQYYRGQPRQPFLSGIFFFTLDYSIGLRTLEGFIDIIYLFPLFYSLFLIGIIYYRNWSFEKVWKTMLALLLAWYSFSLFHPYWFLWVQPFLTLLVAEDYPKFLKLYLALVVLFFIYSGYWNIELIEMMKNVGLPAYQVINMFRSIFSAICIFTTFLIMRTFVHSKKGGQY